jgi:peptidoglycan hydrolase CwlO-like protein
MKRKIILAIGICLVVLVAICFSFVVHDAGVMNRGDHAQSIITHLAWSVEEYREDHGKYPTSLSELASNSDANVKDVLDQELQTLSNFKLKLEYQPRTNGFTISVSGIDSWRPGQDTLRKEYKIGEALK